MNHRPAAFTLLELLIVVAIIALLAALLTPALSKARAVAMETHALASIRQVMIGHTMYQLDNRQHVPWGYPPFMVSGHRVQATLASGHTLPQPGGLSLPVMRYPVRLVPYVQHAWRVLYQGDTPPAEPAPQDPISDVAAKAYALSVNPSFGLNTIFVGGDLEHQGFGPGPQFRPNRGKHVIFRSSEVRHPGRQIVFTDAQQHGGGVAGGTGFHRATPPVAKGRKWRAEGDKFVIVDGSVTMGLPQGRFTTRSVTAFFDGHAAAMQPTELDNMALWFSKAQSVDDDYFN